LTAVPAVSRALRTALEKPSDAIWFSSQIVPKPHQVPKVISL
jgi:hypothetical protein